MPRVHHLKFGPSSTVYKDITGLWLSAVVGVGVEGVGVGVDDLCGDGFCGDVVVVRDV